MRTFWIALLSLSSWSAHARPPATTATEIRPLLIGQRAPSAIVTDPDGKPVDLAKLLAEQPTVLIFLRGGWCHYCQVQLSQLRLIETALTLTGYRIVVVTADSPARVRASIRAKPPSYSVLSDSKGAASQAFGLAYAALVEHFGTAANMEVWKASHGQARPWLPVPAVFLVHRSGLIVYEYINVDFRVRLSAEVLLTAAQAYAEAR